MQVLDEPTDEINLQNKDKLQKTFDLNQFQFNKMLSLVAAKTNSDITKIQCIYQRNVLERQNTIF